MSTEVRFQTLTQKLLNSDSTLQPSPYWFFNGRRLSDIYNDIYE